MKILKALVLLGICAIVLESYWDWAGLSGNGGVADSSTIAPPAAEHQVTEDARIVDDATADLTEQAIEDTESTDPPALDKAKSDAQQEDAILRIHMLYTWTTVRA